MLDEIIEKAGQLRSKNTPFAIAVVVRYEAPISGKPGDKAIILEDGSIHGWIGGGCTQPVVIREAQNAIADGESRFVRVTPASDRDPLEGILEYNMSCHSGGTLDVYIEPVLPKPMLVIIGKSTVAQTLAQLGKVMKYQVHVQAPNASAELFANVDSLKPEIDLSQLPMRKDSTIVVATQGQFDEEAMEAAINSSAGYVAFVASKKKASAVFDYLRNAGIKDQALAEISVPAGLDIKAHLPEEIAVSILAEIIQFRRSTPATELGAHDKKKKAANATAIDPICKMTVDIATAMHTSIYEGETWYFCCAGCKQSFEMNPAKYLEAKDDSEPDERDPVCGMAITAGAITLQGEHDGQSFYFCSPGCKDLFDKQPQLYASLAKGSQQ